MLKRTTVRASGSDTHGGHARMLTTWKCCAGKRLGGLQNEPQGCGHCELPKNAAGRAAKVPGPRHVATRFANSESTANCASLSCNVPRIFPATGQRNLHVQLQAEATDLATLQSKLTAHTNPVIVDCTATDDVPSIYARCARNFGFCSQ